MSRPLDIARASWLALTDTHSYCMLFVILSPIFLLVQIKLVQLLVGSLVRLLVGKSYHTKQKDGYSLPTNDATNNPINWIWMSKKIGHY